MKPSARLRSTPRAASESAASDSPAIRTTPLDGRSSPPRICSNVVLPEPDAPTIASVSARPTLRSTPVSTSSRWPASTKCLATPSQLRTGDSFMSQSLGRVGARGTPGGIQGGEATQRERGEGNERDVADLDLRRQVAHEVHAGVQELCVSD